MMLVGLGLLVPLEAQAATPTFRAAGAVASAANAITPAMPAGVLQNDILLLFLETFDQAVTVSGGTETWAQVTGSPVTGATGTRLTVFWARASQNSPTSPTTVDSGDHQLGRIIAVQGCITTGNPWDIATPGIENVSDTSVSFPGVTTTVAETLVVLAMAGDLPDLATATNFGTWTETNLTSITERIDNTVSAGNGGALGVATGEMLIAGPIGASGVTLTAAAVKAMMTIALKPIPPDTTPPAVNTINRANSNPTNAASIQYTVTFSESVTGVDTTDFTLTTTGVTGASVTGVSGSGATYTVTVGTGSGDGTIRLDLTDNDTIADAGGNKLGGTGAGNGNYTTGELYTIDKTAPATVSDSISPNPTNAGATVTWHADENGTFDVRVGGTSCATGTSVASGSYSTQPNTVNTTIPAGNLSPGSNSIWVCVTDAATNAGSANSSVTKDTVAPTAAITYSASGPYKAGANVTITATFSEDIADSPAPQIAISGADILAAANMSKSSATVYTYDYTVGSGDGSATVVLSTGIDLAGNTVVSDPTSGATFTVDNTVPIFSNLSPDSDVYTNNSSAGYTLSEPVTSGTITFTQTGGTADPGSPHIYTMVSGDMAADSHSVNTGKTLVNGAIYTVRFDASDAAGNTADLTESTNVSFDTTAASVALSSPAGGSRTNNANVSYTLDTAIGSGQIKFTQTGGTADPSSPHTYTMAGTDLNAGEHLSLATGLTLVDGAIYTVSIENVFDLAGNPSSTVANTNVTFDSTAVAITATAPTASSYIKTAVVSYSLSEQTQSGSITFTQTGGTADPASPQNFVLTGTNLDAGIHTDVATGLTLVDGAVYTVSFNATDMAGNPATSVSNALVTFDTTAIVISATAPSSGSYVNTKAVSYTLSELAQSGNVTFTRTGGTTDLAAPHTFNLTGANLTVGAHAGVDSALPLVDGTIYTVAFNAADLAGNPATEVPNTLVTFDTTLPILNSVHIASSNADPAKAITGNTITLTFTASENITAPSVSIAGQSVTPTGGPTSWSASYVVQAADPLGLVSFSVYAFTDAAGNSGMTVATTTDASSVTIEEAPISSTVNVTLAGTGNGTVNSTSVPDPLDDGLTCPGNCSGTYAGSTQVTLTAVPDWKSDFIDWTIGCIGTATTCSFTPDGDTGVTATFNFKPNVEAPGAAHYATVQDAYDTFPGGLLKLRDITFSEDLNLNLAKTITLDGGYSDTWSKSGSTNINGTMTIAAGEVTISDITIQ